MLWANVAYAAAAAARVFSGSHGADRAVRSNAVTVTEMLK